MKGALKWARCEGQRKRPPQCNVKVDFEKENVVALFLKGIITASEKSDFKAFVSQNNLGHVDR